MKHHLSQICALLSRQSNFYFERKNIHYSFVISLGFLCSFHRPLTDSNTRFFRFLAKSFEHSYDFYRLLFVILRIPSDYLKCFFIQYFGADLYFLDYFTKMSIDFIYFNFMQAYLQPMQLYFIKLSKITPS